MLVEKVLVCVYVQGEGKTQTYSCLGECNIVTSLRVCQHQVHQPI
jgi:hypothetical protein